MLRTGLEKSHLCQDLDKQKVFRASHINGETKAQHGSVGLAQRQETAR